MDPYQAILDKFKCPKCHNNTSIHKQVSLSKVSEKILGGHSDKYLLVSCSLCGYTETYNLKVVAHAAEKKAVPNGVMEPHEG